MVDVWVVVNTGWTDGCVGKMLSWHLARVFSNPPYGEIYYLCRVWCLQPGPFRPSLLFPPSFDEAVSRWKHDMLMARQLSPNLSASPLSLQFVSPHQLCLWCLKILVGQPRRVVWCKTVQYLLIVARDMLVSLRAGGDW